MQILVIKSRTSGGTVPLQREFTEFSTVQELYDAVDKELSPAGSWYLIFTTKNLDGFKSKKLCELGMNDPATVCLAQRVQGGEKRLQTKLAGWVTLSNEECNILYIEPDPGCYNAKMTCCGFIISPEAMTSSAKNALEKGYQFHCPQCKREWPYEVVKHVGCFTREEQLEIERKLAEMYMEKSGSQQCPKCYSYCDRSSHNESRVVCAECTERDGRSYEFCWRCLHAWPSSEADECGNEECSGSDGRNHHLRTCGQKEIEYTEIMCPSVRACPHCGILIKHESGCKRMDCEHCQKPFCFVCLGVRLQHGELACGDHLAVCQVAPVQQF